MWEGGYKLEWLLVDLAYVACLNEPDDIWLDSGPPKIAGEPSTARVTIIIPQLPRLS